MVTKLKLTLMRIGPASSQEVLFTISKTQLGLPGCRRQPISIAFIRLPYQVLYFLS